MPTIEVVPGYKITGHTTVSIANWLSISMDNARALKEGGTATIEDNEHNRELMRIGVIALPLLPPYDPGQQETPVNNDTGGDDDAG